MEEDKKIQKKILKEAKKAEKLAKLKKKEGIVKTISSKPKEKKAGKGGFNSTEVESYWVEFWKKNKIFTAKSTGDKVFTMILPPPNITGSLHIGHAMMIAVEDSIARYKRLNGYDVLYLPGLDHAGIATQNVVLKSVGNVDREAFMKAAHDWTTKYGDKIVEQMDRMGCSLDYSRKRFTLDERASNSVNVAFNRLYKKGLIYREKKIVNWCGKLRTTVSDLEVVHKDVPGGSNLNVDGKNYKFGVMYYIKYTLTKDNKVIENDDNLPYVIIGTTRPETILGDSAICINPNDKRFKDQDELFRRGFVNDLYNNTQSKYETYETCNGIEAQRNGIFSYSEDINCNALKGLEIASQLKKEKKAKYKTSNQKCGEEKKYERPGFLAINPITGKKIPVIFDEQADISFGSGILKITPFHDVTDFNLGKKHDLEFIKVFDEDNKIVISGKYMGMKRFEARKAIVEDLKQSGRLVKEEEHDQILPFCSRSNDIIEPVVLDQWWMKCDGMAKRAIKSVQSGEIEIFPEEAKKAWYRWLENIKDWCLSRQLWWGHRIPAWKATKNGVEEWIVAENYEDAQADAKKRGLDIIGQESDVLDTWFSSGLWPFSSIGWPEETDDFKRHFPNSLLETGSDILFFWVARMVMLSYELCETRPFKQVLLHGIVRDSHGRKMSKSLGNVIDPVYVIEGIQLKDMVNKLQEGNLDRREVSLAIGVMKKDFPHGIAKCGADALRFTLLSYSNGMRDINLDIRRVEGYSKLCNKLYNAYNYIAMANNNSIVEKVTKGELLDIVLMEHQKWILKKLNILINEEHASFNHYNFMIGTQKIHEFFLYQFCDIFLEITKKRHENDIKLLNYVFDAILVIFNPFMPFITEDLYFKLHGSVLSEESSYPSTLELTLGNHFESIIHIGKLSRVKNLVIEKGKYKEYLEVIAHGKATFTDVINNGESLAGIKYKIIE